MKLRQQKCAKRRDCESTSRACGFLSFALRDCKLRCAALLFRYELLYLTAHPYRSGYFLRLSRICRSNNTSSGVGGGSVGACEASFLSLFICLIIMKMMKARIMK